jgi:D-alanine transaminase
MSRVEQVYLNGEFVPHGQAVVSVEDRGFNFADGIYEVVRVVGGRPFRLEDHLDRFEGGARALEIGLSLSREEIGAAIENAIAANEVAEGTVYVQLTRGAAPRSHPFPEGVKPTLVMLSRASGKRSEENWEKGVAVLTAPDLRWGYCEVKTIGLLPNLLALQRAKTGECFEAILVRDGIVTEGSHTSAFCVRDGTVLTHPIDNILPSITRKNLIAALGREGIEVRETGVPLDEFRSADEVFLTGTTVEVMPIVKIDGEVAGSGTPGELTRLAMDLYRRDLESFRANG